MNPDKEAFISVSAQTTISALWRAMQTIRQKLAISRVYWHRDQRYADGIHFCLEIPIHQVVDPIATKLSIQAILADHGAAVL